MPGLIHGCRIICLHGASRLQELADEGQRRRLAHVIGAGLVGETPDGCPLSFNVSSEVITELGEEHLLLPLIDSLNGFKQRQRRPVVLPGPDKCLDILGEA